MPPARSLRSLTISGNRTKSPGPPSPTFSETTNASAMNFGPDGPEKIITRANLKASLQAYEELLSKCAAYRAALLTMSKATAAFADAMEICSGLKGPTYESGTRLQAASGLHHLMGNHWHLLADTMDKQVEKPLRSSLDTYRTVVNERSSTYEKALHEKSSIIRQTEMGNMKKKGRNLQTFREALAILQRQVDELDDLKAQHYQDIVEHEEEVWDVVQGKICVVVRSTLDVFDRFTSKAYGYKHSSRPVAAADLSLDISSDPVIEPMLQAVPDPFDSYGPPPAEDKIFSILPPLSVIANAPSSSPSPMTSTTPELENSSDGLASGKSSWTQSGAFFSDASAAWADNQASSLGTTPPSTPPRSISPSVLSSPSVSPPTNTRRHSHPGGSLAHTHRKSESKLRSVLSVIDEAHARPNGDLGEGSSRTVSESHLSTSIASYGKEHEFSSDEDGDQWGTVKGTPSNGLSLAEDETTPRNSIFRSQSPASHPADDDGHTPSERSRSPRSDETAVPIS
ncbi:hypothetical protein EUX98_g388 [Antrodiella citrinella]|uniref:IMD domain-containing protein n=1 Tax=Antrodiella citrinella TaxID=2447956 RepID=A0A4S4N420_9APHY|nr:hypothetical protein EUX98_g388 [Antrodiella citrinella]